MNKQKLQEYIKKYIQETETAVVTGDSQSKTNIKNTITQSDLPGDTKTDLIKKVNKSKKGDSFTLEEAEQNIRTSLQRLLLLSREIADSVEDADLDSPEIISLQSDVDNFVNTVLKPFYNKI
jgi:hypothetical protein